MKNVNLGTGIQRTNKARQADDDMVRLIMRADRMQELMALSSKLSKGSLDVPGYLRDLSKTAVEKLAETLMDDDKELSFKAAKEILDRAGHAKVNKVAVGHFTADHQASRLELVNTILSLAKKSGVQVNDEEHVQGAIEGEIIDVKADEDEREGSAE